MRRRSTSGVEKGRRYSGRVTQARARAAFAKPALVAGALLLLCGPIVAALLLRPRASDVAATSGTPAPASPSTPPAYPHFPAPPAGAVVFSRRMGADDLALAIVPGRPLVLQASVVGAQGNGITGRAVRISVNEVTHTAAPCGPGCYRADFAASRPRSVAVAVNGADGTTWHVPPPSSWPPPDATALVARAGRVWRSLRSLAFVDRLASGHLSALTTRWRVAAPDKVAYQIRGGASAVIVGGSRWDRTSNTAKWVQSDQTPLTQPLPAWYGVRDAHVLGSSTFEGHPVWIVSFYDPNTPAWFTIAVEKSTTRTLDMHMIATSHFMHDTYSSFDSAPPIVPPSR